MSTPTFTPTMAPTPIDNSFSNRDIAGITIEAIVAFLFLAYGFFLILLYRDGKNWKEATKEVFSTMTFGYLKKPKKKTDSPQLDDPNPEDAVETA